MKKYLFLIIATGSMLVGSLFASCAGEDELTAEEDNRSSYFAPDPSATDEVSIMRRDFYQEQGSYLLFTDTLRHEPLGRDYNGTMQYFTETVDLGYSVGATMSSLSTYSYTYLNTLEEKKEALAFLKTYVLTHLNNLHPYSWLLVKTITVTTNDDVSDAPAAAGERAIAVAYDAEQLTDESSKEALGQNVLSTVLSSVLSSSKNDDKLQTFYAISESLYDSSYPVPDYTQEGNLQYLNAHGFIILKWLIPNVWPYYGMYPSKSDDLKSYINLIFNSTEAEVKEKYADCPIVLQKYTLLKELLKEVGYKE